MPRVGGPVAGPGVGRRPAARRRLRSSRRASRPASTPSPRWRPRHRSRAPRPRCAPRPRIDRPVVVHGSPRRRRRSRSASTSAARRARAWYSGPCLRGSAYSRGLIVQYVPEAGPYQPRPATPGRAASRRLRRTWSIRGSRSASSGAGSRAPRAGGGEPGGRDRSPLVAHSVPARGPAPLAVRRRGPVVGPAPGAVPADPAAAPPDAEDVQPARRAR